MLEAKVAEFDAIVPDWEVAQLLNAPNPAYPRVLQRIAAGDARGVLMKSGDWPRVVMASEPSNTNPLMRGMAILLHDAVTTNIGVDTDEPESVAQASACMQVLVTADVIKTATMDALLALTEREQSWAEHNAVHVDARAVGIARGANVGADGFVGNPRHELIWQPDEHHADGGYHRKRTPEELAALENNA